MLKNYFYKLESETRLEAIRYWLCNHTRPVMVWNTITYHWYRDRLWKSIIWERYIDYDYCSWWLAWAIVDILENTLHIYTEDICQESNQDFIQASEDIKDHIKMYKDNWQDNDKQSVALNIILQYIHKYRNRLWF